MREKRSFNFITRGLESPMRRSRMITRPTVWKQIFSCCCCCTQQGLTTQLCSQLAHSSAYEIKIIARGGEMRPSIFKRSLQKQSHSVVKASQRSHTSDAQMACVKTPVRCPSPLSLHPPRRRSLSFWCPSRPSRPNLVPCSSHRPACHSTYSSRAAERLDQPPDRSL